MMPGMLRLGELLKILDPVVRWIFVHVMDDVSQSHGVIRMIDVPYVLVALNVAVAPNGGVKVPFRLGYTNEDPALVARPCPA
jgi:hypothetical protein